MAPLRVGAGRLLLDRRLDALQQRLLPPPLRLPLRRPLPHARNLGVEILQRVVAAGGPGAQLGVQGGHAAGGEVAQRGDGGDGDARGGGVERAGDEVRVDGRDEQVLEGARRGDVEGLAEVGVGEVRGGRGGEGEEGEELELGGLGVGERGERGFGGCCVLCVLAFSAFVWCHAEVRRRRGRERGVCVPT